LENRVEELEQYTRKEDIIITGLKIDRKYSDTVKGNSANGMDNRGRNHIEEQVITKLNDHGIRINPDEILACHTLGRQNDDGTHKVIVTFFCRKTKTKTLFNAKKLKGTGIYINEHLTKRNAGLAKQARDMKKQEKIEST
jgi:hypothetical protein